MKYFIAAFVFTLCLKAEIFFPAKGDWVLDLPSKWTADTSMSPAFTSFRSPESNILAYVWVFPAGKFANLNEAEDKFLKDMQWQPQRIYVENEKGDAVLCDGVLTISNEKYSALAGIYFKKGRDAYAVMAVLPQPQWASKKHLAESFIDSFSPARSEFMSPGLVMQADIKSAPAADKISKAAKIPFGENTFDFVYHESVRTSAAKLVDRESLMLLEYKTADFEAMRRYYRLIARATFDEIAPFADFLKQRGIKLGRNAEDNLVNTWYSIQDFRDVYINELKFFKSPVDVMLFQEGDCDSKSLLLHMICAGWNMKSEMLLSFGDSHAALGIPFELFSTPKSTFLVGENHRPLVFMEMLQTPADKTPYHNPAFWKAFLLLPAELDSGRFF